MKVDKSKKIHARALGIEVGTKCNLKCKHCYLGDAPELTIKPQYIDAVLENVYEIDDLWFTGGEITFYLDEIELVLHKIIEAKIRVNYICFVTNGTIKSERLVKLFERFRKITTFPDKAGIRISVDEFHSEQSRISEKDMEGVIRWYQSRVGGEVEASRLEGKFLSLEGRALKLPASILDNYKKIVLKRKIKSDLYKIDFNQLCEAEKNACGYGCVRNCFTSTLYLAADGYLYASSDCSYDLKERSDFALCHVMNSSIYDAMSNWNNDCEKSTENPFIVIKSDSVNFNFIIMQACFYWFMLDLADAYEQNNFEYMHTCATMLDYCIEKWNSFLINNDIKECLETIQVAKMVEYLKTIYEVVFKDVLKIPSVQDKEVKEYAIARLRENGDLKRIYRNVFVSYITKDLDNYIKYYDKALQWVEENGVKSDGMVQLIKENNVQ